MKSNEEISDIESDCDVRSAVNVNHSQAKKRKTFGRITDVSKKLRLQSHFPGPDCHCKRLLCFQNVPECSRNNILKQFNLMSSVDEQNSYLCGLISVQKIQNRRSRQDEENAKFKDAVYSYRVRFLDNEKKIQEIQVCFKAFLAIHGITKKKMEVLQKSLKEFGMFPKDQRGKHSSRPRKLSREQTEAVMGHIRSFKGRKGHYNLAESAKTYLQEDLNIKKMHNMYIEKYPNLKVSYESYRTIFSTKFNLSFGYPRKDTCSTCDEFQVKIKNLEVEKSHISENTNSTEYLRIENEVKRLEIENKVHRLNADTFYKRKREAKKRSKKSNSEEAICFDFQKNLPTPNISTNDVYYRRQLSVYSFNVHILSTGESTFYTYPETVGRKGSDDVYSMLHDFVYNHLDINVRRIFMFCDSCGRQNKNFTVFRFLHNLVHKENKFDEIKIFVPIRGHSYLETDKNMGLVNQKAKVEQPNEWAEIFREARVKPSPFSVIEVDQLLFRNWSDHLNKIYTKKCPFRTRPVREAKIVKTHPRFVFYRNSYNGPYGSEVIANRRQIRGLSNLQENEFELPHYLYEGLIPISKAKFDDVVHLSRFCTKNTEEFFKALPHAE